MPRTSTSGPAARSAVASRSFSGARPGQAASAGARERARRSERARKRDRALRRAVVRLQGCLGRVPRSERRVLVLRAGVGIARTRSRAEVARITGLRRTRVARLERRGLRHLRALDRAGACSISAGGQQRTIAAPPVGSPPPGGGPAGRGDVLAERRSGGDQRSQRSGGSSEQSSVLPIARPNSSPGGGGSPMDLTFIIIPVALATFVLVLFRELRRQT